MAAFILALVLALSFMWTAFHYFFCVSHCKFLSMLFYIACIFKLVVQLVKSLWCNAHEVRSSPSFLFFVCTLATRSEYFMKRKARKVGICANATIASPWLQVFKTIALQELIEFCHQKWAIYPYGYYNH